MDFYAFWIKNKHYRLLLLLVRFMWMQKSFNNDVFNVLQEGYIIRSRRIKCKDFNII